ncbi:RING-H2 finger protein ATL5-like [Telopea speciosissima]|uniref:RING-H2 finger protein ATL5-like n=1 Tax=Telopea speciosissima TaxID=54955 RepID=UPI001CC378BE|nr:RING-H2 finger protein ATL5-like [Telopea speciosissima]
MALGASNSSTIMLCVTISLVLVVLFYVMAGWVSRYRASRRAGTDHLAAAMQVRSGETSIKQGLDPSIIAALPIFVYNGSSNAIKECPICLSNIEEEEMTILLPNCNHMFHAQCINVWLNSQSTCPICRCGVAPQEAAMPETIESSVVIPFEAPVMVTSDGGSGGDASDDVAESSKVGGLRRPLSSFCKMGMVISSERLERRIQLCGQTDHEPEDLERQ